MIEIDVQNPDQYTKEYLPLAAKATQAGGGRYIVRGAKAVPIDGTPPTRLMVVQFESLEKAQATFTSAAYKDARKVGDKYAKFRVFAVEGMAQ